MKLALGLCAAQHSPGWMMATGWQDHVISQIKAICSGHRRGKQKKLLSAG
jgi:hypothetical protein